MLDVYGIEIRQVGVERLTLPSETLVATVARMKAERETVAAQRTAEGLRQAAAIRADADRDGRQLVAQARQQAAQTEADAQQAAAKIYAGAYQADPGSLHYAALARHARHHRRAQHPPGAAHGCRAVSRAGRWSARDVAAGGAGTRTLQGPTAVMQAGHHDHDHDHDHDHAHEHDISACTAAWTHRPIRHHRLFGHLCRHAAARRVLARQQRPPDRPRYPGRGVPLRPGRARPGSRACCSRCPARSSRCACCPGPTASSARPCSRCPPAAASSLRLPIPTPRRPAPRSRLAPRRI